MPTRFTEFHISSPKTSMCLRAKDHLEGTKVAVFPRYCAEQKVQTGSAAAGGHRGVATKKTTGALTTRRGAGDPVRRAEFMTVSRYGHLRSAPVVVDVGLRTEWEPPTLRAALWVSTRQSWRLHDGLLPLQRRAFPVQAPNFAIGSKVPGPEGRERSRSPALLSCPCGLWASMRYTVRVDSTARHFTLTLGVVFTYDSRLWTSPRPHGLWASMRRPVPTGLPSTHGGCEFRSESSMKASTSFTDSEDQCLCGQFKGFEYRERLDECSALLLW